MITVFAITFAPSYYKFGLQNILYIGWNTGWISLFRHPWPIDHDLLSCHAWTHLPCLDSTLECFSILCFKQLSPINWCWHNPEDSYWPPIDFTWCREIWANHNWKKALTVHEMKGENWFIKKKTNANAKGKHFFFKCVINSPLHISFVFLISFLPQYGTSSSPYLSAQCVQNILHTHFYESTTDSEGRSFLCANLLILKHWCLGADATWKAQVQGILMTKGSTNILLLIKEILQDETVMEKHKWY